MTELELRCGIDDGTGSHQALRSFFEHVAIVDINAPIKDGVVGIRRNTRLKLPDAIIAATALVLDATLLTNDTRLLEIPGVKARPVGLIPRAR